MADQQGLLAVRDTIYFDPDGGPNHHLWVVIAETADVPAGRRSLILACMTTAKSLSDRSCVLQKGERGQHPFVQHETVIDYRRLKLVEAGALSAHAGKRRQPVSPIILERIQTGAHLSPHTRRDLKALIPDPRAPAP